MPQLRYGELARVLWVEVLQNDVQCSASDAEKVACEGVG